jgi:hypothetical protein
MQSMSMARPSNDSTPQLHKQQKQRAYLVISSMPEASSTAVAESGAVGSPRATVGRFTSRTPLLSSLLNTFSWLLQSVHRTRNNSDHIHSTPPECNSVKGIDSIVAVVPLQNTRHLHIHRKGWCGPCTPMC